MSDIVNKLVEQDFSDLDFEGADFKDYRDELLEMLRKVYSLVHDIVFSYTQTVEAELIQQAMIDAVDNTKEGIDPELYEIWSSLSEEQKNRLCRDVLIGAFYS